MQIRKNYPIASLTTFKLGHTAEFFVAVSTPENLLEAIQWALKRGISWHLLAGGSNTVLPDVRLKGLLIHVRNGIIRSNGLRWKVDAGVSLMRLVRRTCKEGYSGIEALTSIPGSVGGAISGNAGAYGHSISETIARVEIWDGGRRRWISKRACRFGYRESIFKHMPWVILRAEFVFKRGDSRALQRESRRIARARAKKYSSSLHCPGSYFKNIPVARISSKVLKGVDSKKIVEGKIPAGYLLEAVGAKKMRQGDIYVAEFHGNVIVNQGNGTTKDVMRLVYRLKKKVWNKFHILLEEEVRYL